MLFAIFAMLLAGLMLLPQAALPIGDTQAEEAALAALSEPLIDEGGDRIDFPSADQESAMIAEALITPGLTLLGALPFPSAAEEAAIIADAVAAPPQLDWLVPFRRRLNEAANGDRVVGLAVAVLEAGEPVLVFTTGVTAAGTRERVTPDTVFRGASVTKTFTGTLLAMLEAEGRIDLDSAVPQDVLRLPGNTAASWLQVASHQTGLPRNAYDNLIEAGRDVKSIRDRLSTLSPVCGVGDCYSYQNVAFSSAEALIEETTGFAYAEALQRYIFDPYGLDTASVGSANLVGSQRWARPHRGWARRYDAAGNPRSNYDAMPSAAGVNLSLNDMIAWAQANLRTTGGLPLEVRDRVRTAYVDTPRETRGLGEVRARVQDTAYGLGWRIYHWGDRTLIMHSGYLSGYGAQIVMEPATGFAFVALWNADSRVPWRLWPTAMDLRTGDGPGNWLDELKG